MTALAARRLVLPGGEVAGLCARLGLGLPPGFAHARTAPTRADLLRDGVVHPSLAAGLATTCRPEVGVLIASTAGDVAAAFGVRGDLGASLARAGGSPVEVSAWPAAALGAELARAVPALPGEGRTALHLPLPELAAALRAAVIATLHATVVAPPAVLGQVVWLGTADGWLSVLPAQARDGLRWATVRSVTGHDLGAAVAPFVASAAAVA